MAQCLLNNTPDVWATWKTHRRSRISSHLKSTRISSRASPEGSGGAGGIVLPLDLEYSGSIATGGRCTEDAACFISYTLPVTFGSQGQTLSVQIDTGSSDLWIASTSCKTSTCQQANGALYDGRSATQSGCDFSIQYLAGEADGPIVWDQVTIGGYQIDNQALAAVNYAKDEPLGSFSGVLGLALPSNSIISQQIPPSISNAPDGAVIASNLFGSSDSAPAARFLSVSLSRPGSDKIPSTLGIGKHPSAIISDPSIIKYSRIATGGDRSLFWKTVVSEIAVWVDGVKKTINLSSAAGTALPTAVIDTGVPVILTTSAIANGIYGAVGVGPGSDGQYYLPCTTPLNMTVTVNGLVVALHPLDLTAQTKNSDTCIGLIQTADSQLGRDTSIGDMVLGVPFMRNVYTVMAYTPPLSNGTFDPITPSEIESGAADIEPRLGLLNLTNPTIAMQEFDTVRVQGKPLSTGGDGSGNSGVDSTPHHGLSIGLKIFIGLISAFAFIVIIFLGRFLYQRRSWKKNYHKTANKSLDGTNAPTDGVPMSDVPDATLREMHFEEYMKRKAVESGYTGDSVHTRVEEDDQGEDEMMMDEFGLVYFSKKRDRKASYESSAKRSTLVDGEDPGTPGSHRRLPSMGPNAAEPLLTSSSSRGWTDSYFSTVPEAPTPAVDVVRDDVSADLGEMGAGTRESMAGVGTRNTRRLTSDDFSAAAMTRLSTHRPISPPIARPARSVRPSSTLRQTRGASLVLEQEGTPGDGPS